MNYLLPFAEYGAFLFRNVFVWRNFGHLPFRLFLWRGRHNLWFLSLRFVGHGSPSELVRVGNLSAEQMVRKLRCITRPRLSAGRA